VDGLELIFAGDPLDRWHVFGGYTYLQTGIIASPQGDLGYRLQNAPKHAVKFWSTYDLTEDLTVGGGVQYVGNRTVQSGPDPAGFLQIVPSYWTVDLMARYRLTEAVALQANIKNLNNAYGFSCHRLKKGLKRRISDCVAESTISVRETNPERGLWLRFFGSTSKRTSIRSPGWWCIAHGCWA
jgi:outer membrane receptor for ferric coprogen and ferric-rhodotorulic acid